MSIIRALSDASDDAKLYGRKPPVILTDRTTARILARAIEAELGGPLPCSMPGVVVMFDGVQIRAAVKPVVRVKMGRRVVTDTAQFLYEWWTEKPQPAAFNWERF